MLLRKFFAAFNKRGFREGGVKLLCLAFVMYSSFYGGVVSFSSHEFIEGVKLYAIIYYQTALAYHTCLRILCIQLFIVGIPI